MERSNHEQYYSAGPVAAGLTLALSLVSCSGPTNKSPRVQNQIRLNQMPRVEFQIGSNVWDIERISGLRFDLPHKTDITPIVIESEVSVLYIGKPGEMELPLTRYVWITQYAGKVVELQTSPQLEGLPLEQANALANQLMDLFANSGWQNIARFPTDLNVIRAVLTEPGRTRPYSKQYGEWAAGSNRLRLSLKELGWSLPDKPVSTTFVVNCDFRDPDASTREMKAVLDKRRAYGNVNQALPLTAWLEDKP